jgi:hypothetical protein
MDTNEILNVLQQQQTNAMISGGTEKVIDTINRDTRFLNQNIIDGTARTVGAIETHSLGLRDAIERNASGISGAVERTSGATQSAIERIAGEGRLTTVTADAASRQAAADANRDIQVTIERTAANNFNAIQRGALEGRLAGAVNDSATRQSAADQARDILSAIERNAGEGRLTTVTTDMDTRNIITDSRRDIIDDLNRGVNEIMGAVNNSANETRISSLQSNMELRNQFSTGLAQMLMADANNTSLLTSKLDNNHSQAILENHRLYDRNAMQNARDHSEILLEGQKQSTQLSGIISSFSERTALQNARDHAQILLEGQKQSTQITGELAALSKQGSDQYASMIIEANRNKEMLAAQAANHFAVSQLEQQKVKEAIMEKLAEAKYEGLKNKESLAAQLADHNTDIKSTVRALDENRVRDALGVANNEVNMLKYLGPYHHHHGHHHGRHSRSRSPTRNYNITNVYEDERPYGDYYGRRHRGRGGRGSRGSRGSRDSRGSDGGR